MKVVILAGGRGTRLAEKIEIIPKLMVEIGEYPILWYIMKHYAQFGYLEFVIALGYKDDIIKRYFTDYQRWSGDLRIDLAEGRVDVASTHDENWIVDLVDTGLESQTGGRIKRHEEYLEGERFLRTYGDGLSNVHIDRLLEFQEANWPWAPPLRSIHRPAYEVSRSRATGSPCIRKSRKRVKVGSTFASWSSSRTS